MATLEDKIAGDKLQYYCSSSESEGERDDDNDGGDDEPRGGRGGGTASAKGAEAAAPPKSLAMDRTHWAGTSTNTGPKGVVQDWQLFKQLEAQKREENDQQRIDLMKKLSMTASSAKEDEARKRDEELDAELAELMSEDFLQQFQKQRMAEMLKASGRAKTFGKVQQLQSSDEFLNAVDNEDKLVTVVVHIYDRNVAACGKLNECLDTLAGEYVNVKFAKICSSVAGMSRNFRSKGLPALLVYRGNNLIGNHVRLTDELSDDFFPSDLESFLIENGVIVDKSLYN